MQGAAMTTPILQKTEALRSQSSVLADPKDCSAPSSKKPLYDRTAPSFTQTQRQFNGLWKLSTLLSRPTSPPKCVVPSG